MNRTIGLFFLGGTAPCEVRASSSYYAYGVVTERGGDPEYDFAPDDAWLKMP